MCFLKQSLLANNLYLTHIKYFYYIKVVFIMIFYSNPKSSFCQDSVFFTILDSLNIYNMPLNICIKCSYACFLFQFDTCVSNDIYRYKFNLVYKPLYFIE